MYRAGCGSGVDARRDQFWKELGGLRGGARAFETELLQLNSFSNKQTITAQSQLLKKLAVQLSYLHSVAMAVKLHLALGPRD